MHVWQKYSTFIVELGLRINFRVMVNQCDKFQNKIISGLIPISDVFFLQFKRFSSIQNVSSLENITPSFRRFGPKPWLLWRFFTSPSNPFMGKLRDFWLLVIYGRYEQPSFVISKEAVIQFENSLFLFHGLTMLLNRK